MNFTLEVCPTIQLLNLYSLEGKVVVIIDIFRATSSIVAGIGSGVPKIVTFKNPKNCKLYKSKGFITAGEQNGKKVPYLDFGNSPVDFENIGSQKCPIALTTTNGAKAIALSQKAEMVVIGSFLNISTLTDFLIERATSVLLLCAGWRGHINIEDTFFAGALCERLKLKFSFLDDATFMSHDLYLKNKNLGFKCLQNGAHYKRLMDWGNEKDINYSFQIDRFNVVPQLGTTIFAGKE